MATGEQRTQEEVVRLHLTVSGRVQMVGYRYYCHEMAARLRLTGYARNMPDGSVVVEVQGERAEVEEFAIGAALGPRLSEVTAVKRRALVPLDRESGFRKY